ncbi:Rhodanese-like domain-containing protein 7 [Dichanthelium oligosanthes]|uniref:Rhodanese-like domain-containing protein 7 n=1 Tax=Dichanthelium oligosanthes TaxID=888268 RepID=A0A1E5WKL0_9POAL|nr:Rhodanese-like domain-containing protein 7 [Dichanthelium oligosanthes]
MLPSPPLAAALSKTAAAATRRAATVAASVAAQRLLFPARSPTHDSSAPSSLIPRHRFGHMPQEWTAPLVPLLPLGRNYEVAVGDGGVDGEAPALVVVSFYRFADFPDHASFRRPLKELCEDLVDWFKEGDGDGPLILTRVSGGIILAPEGINGSICGTPASVEKILNFIQEDNRLKGLRMIQSPVTPEDEAIHHGHTSQSPVGAGHDAPFRWDHVRVKLKKEIVTFGDPGVMPTKMVGKFVKPKDWNALISDPDTVVIDVRNMYEIRIGKFKRAVDPCTNSFREFPTWVDNQFELVESDTQESGVINGSGNVEPAEDLNASKSKQLPRVAMYCTGGIRCEILNISCFACHHQGSQGGHDSVKLVDFVTLTIACQVYHLEGGILKYLEEIPKSESLWDGECFVFDKRVSVEHGLAQGTHKLCYGCKQPVSDEDMESPEWEYGVSCPYCFATKSEEEKERARARQRQFETWGIIGGPDKGRSPKRLDANDAAEAKQLPNSI